jgi:predicted TIM-barrel fold metal-dependent hydrolase
MSGFTRRQLPLAVLGALGASTLRAASPLIDSHVHLFDPEKVPYHPKATYKPPAAPLETYVKFAAEAKIDHTVIVHPEPYQDDHRYLKYCFDHEPSKGFFKGTCLFDPIAADTPARMAALLKEMPGRIVALRIHANADPAKYPTHSGPIRDRDLSSPEMKRTWTATHDLGLAIQMHFNPYYAPLIHNIAAQFPDMPVILDHLGRPSQGKPEEYDAVLRLSELPRTYMKYSGTTYVKGDLRSIVRRVHAAFGPDRIIWGTLGMNMEQFRKESALFDSVFDFTSAEDRAKIRGLNSQKLFRF